MSTIKVTAVIVLFAVLSIVHAQPSLSPVRKLAQDAQQRLMDCDVKESSFKTSNSSTRYTRTAWTGNCVNGKLDGEGSLTIEMDFSGPTFSKKDTTQISGLMIGGVKVGPWLVIRFPSVPSLQGLYEWEDAAVSGTYRKESDGSFRHVDGSDGALVASTAPVTAAQVAQHMQSSRQRLSSGATPSIRGVPFQSALLRDLTRGAEVTKAASSSLVDMKKKHVVLVLSSNTLASFGAMEDFQRKLLEWSGKQADAGVRTAASDLARSVNKQAFASDLSALLSEKFGKVTYADDLANFSKGEADFAVVFDLTFNHKLDEMLTEQIASSVLTEGQISQRYPDALQRFNITPKIMVGSSYFILNKQLEVVRSQVGNPVALNLPRARITSGSEPVGARANAGLAKALKESGREINNTVGGVKFHYYTGVYDNTRSVTYNLSLDLNSPVRSFF